MKTQAGLSDSFVPKRKKERKKERKKHVSFNNETFSLMFIKVFLRSVHTNIET